MLQRLEGWGTAALIDVLHALSIQALTLQPCFADGYMSLLCLVCFVQPAEGDYLNVATSTEAVLLVIDCW